MESIPSPLTSLANSLIAGSPKIKRQSSGKGLLCRTKSGSPSKRPSTKLQTGKNVTAFDPAAPIIPAPSEKLSRAGSIVRASILLRHPTMIQDRKVHARIYKKAMEGPEMVDWMVSHPCVNSRQQAVGMWQALLEEGVIIHVCREHQFMDKALLYRFIEDDEGYTMPNQTSNKKDGEDELLDTLQTLTQIGPDAMLRMILRKAPTQRSLEDLELIYEELLHIKALSHLSTMVKRELASVIMFESHAKNQTVLFNQGDEGKSWYIILKGTVNVLIYGKGVVCTLREGDDFGKLALVNDAPRAATITTNEDNCHFLRVDKEDFNRILRDVEANTVRLNEHGHDVLVLEKIPINKQNGDGSVQSHYKYSVMAGTPEKMLEYLLETRLESTTEETQDDFLEDFLLTHIIFMPYSKLSATLLSHYKSEGSGVQGPNNDAEDFVIANKRRVVQFVTEWQNIAGTLFVEDTTLKQFVEELGKLLHQDCKDHPKLLENASNLLLLNQNGKFKDLLNSPRRSDSKSLYKPQISKSVIKGTDDAQFKVYFADHTYSTVRVSQDATVKEILSSVKEKLGQQDDMVLCEVKSNGEKMIFKENDMSVTAGLSVNGRFFTSPREHLDALTPHPDQEGPNEGTGPILELMSTKDMAYYLVMNDWELFNNLHEYELIYLVFGRHKFRKVTCNLDTFLRQFNIIQYWVVTEVCLCNNLGKRVQLLRKLIKLAAYCKEYNNLNAFFAIIMGLSNTAVSRLSQTWESLPRKFKKMYAEFEALMDPSRNHRSYRLMVAKLEAPYIPFMPLLMKDLTFTHEGNKSHFDGLINFEKMHMVAQTLRTVRRCRSAPMKLDSPNSAKNTIEIRQYVRNLAVLDNQRRATTLSHQLEPRRS